MILFDFSGNMSKFNMETAVGELLKKVSALSTKIASQTVLIEAQSKKIEDQQKIIENNQKTICQQSKVVGELCAKIEKLMLGVTMNASKSETEKPTSKLSTQGAIGIAAEFDVLSLQNDATETERSRRAAERAKAKAMTTLHKRSDSGNKSEGKTDVQKSVNSDEWKIVSHQKRQKKSPINAIQIGGNVQISTFQAIQKKKFLHVWSLHPDTTEDAISEHVTKISGSNDIKVEKIVPKTKRDYATFLIGVPESLFNTVNKAESWPVNTQFNEWVWFRSSRKSAKIR